MFFGGGGGPVDPRALMVNGEILRRCCESIKQLGTKFGRYEKDPKPGLNMTEFKNAMIELKIKDCTEDKIEACFHNMDNNGNKDGIVSLTEFFDMLLGCSMGSEKRLKVVNEAWEHIDKNKDGKIAIHEMARYYDVESHPYVTTGCMTELEAAFDIFCHDFRKRREDKEQSITKQEFDDYHAGVSAKVESCDAYVRYIRLIWKMDKDESDYPPKYQDATFSASKGCSLGSGKRLAAVNTAWGDLNDKKDDKLSLRELANSYNVESHPFVTTGCMNLDEAGLEIFCMQFNKKKEVDEESVNKQEFIDYHERESLKVQDDDAFERYVQLIWKKKNNLVIAM